MRRRLFMLAAATSAVLCAAVCVMWVRSYWRHDEVLLRDGMVASGDGSLDVVRWPPGQGFTLRPVRTGYGTEHALIFPARAVPPPHLYHFPDAYLAFLLVLPAAAYLALEWRRRRRLARRPGCCRKRGYDLRATPHRCPECGMVPVLDDPPA